MRSWAPLGGSVRDILLLGLPLSYAPVDINLQKQVLGATVISLFIALVGFCMSMCSSKARFAMLCLGIVCGSGWMCVFVYDLAMVIVSLQP